MKPTGDEIDKSFFNRNSKGIHHKGIQKIGPSDEV